MTSIELRTHPKLGWWYLPIPNFITRPVTYMWGRGAGPADSVMDCEDSRPLRSHLWGSHSHPNGAYILVKYLNFIWQSSREDVIIAKDASEESQFLLYLGTLFRPFYIWPQGSIFPELLIPSQIPRGLWGMGRGTRWCGDRTEKAEIVEKLIPVVWTDHIPLGK